MLLDIALGTILFFAGMFFWTFMEYTLHRSMGHLKNNWNLFTIEHMKHHHNTDYEAHAIKKAPGAIVTVAITTFAVGYPLGWVFGAIFSTGLLIAYLIYEVLHLRCHRATPLNKYELWIRKHHFHHHHAPKMNHGVTTDLWDKVFGTYEKPDIVVVQKSIAKNWMLDPETGAILDRYKNDFRLRATAA